MTTYLVQIKTDETEYETAHRTTSKPNAERTAQDFAACGHDGRIVTEKGYVSQQWSVQTA